MSEAGKKRSLETKILIQLRLMNLQDSTSRLSNTRTFHSPCGMSEDKIRSDLFGGIVSLYFDIQPSSRNSRLILLSSQTSKTPRVSSS